MKNEDTKLGESEFSMLIDGKLLNSPINMDVLNPANERVAASVPVADVEQLNHAVFAAKVAFSTWKKTSLQQRRDLLAKFANVIDDNAEELAQLLTIEQGKTIKDARDEVMFSSFFCNQLKDIVINDEVLIDDETQRVEIHRRPLGVVAGIVPWNFPLLIAVYKIAPALITGNTIIIKPAPTTPMATLRLGVLTKDIFPAGVLNIIADRNDLGPKITAHPDIDKVSFTGSTPTGKKIMESAANTLKRLTLELGGNDAAIVLADADVEQISEDLFNASFMNSGQICICLKRLYVHESLYDDVCERIGELAKKAIVGDGMADSSQFGPVQNKAQYEKICDYIEGARVNGKIIAGGEIPQTPGYFIPLTVVKDIKDGTRLVDEEPFGPILPIIKFKDIDDVIERANRSDYGLGASVWSSDLKAAYAVAQQLDSGTVWINKHLDFSPNIPFPPSKRSGIGVEWGKEGLLEFTAMKVINIKK